MHVHKFNESEIEIDDHPRLIATPNGFLYKIGGEWSAINNKVCLLEKRDNNTFNVITKPPIKYSRKFHSLCST